MVLVRSELIAIIVRPYIDIGYGDQDQDMMTMMTGR
jgi:hypothetical protein